MAYGSPATTADVEAYYTHVRRGRPPTPELLTDLVRRYDAIGGTSPLLERTTAQAEGLADKLGTGFQVELGMKHAPPFIEDGVAALAGAGITRAVGLVLAPHYSALSVGEYLERARAAGAATRATRLSCVRSWHLEPGYLALLAERAEQAIAATGLDPADVEVVFTAHSLPARVRELGDPYPEQVHDTAAAVAAYAGLPRWSVAWQSAGRTPEPWLGPDLLHVMAAVAKMGARGVVVCPAGFVSDHLEVLYDLDIEARQRAEELGLAFARTASLNDDPAFCGVLAHVVHRQLHDAG